MISYVELANYTITRGPNMILKNVYLEDGMIVGDAVMAQTEQYVRLHPIGIGQLWRDWVDVYRYNVGKLLSFILGRPVTVYGFLHLDRPRKNAPEYPMFVGAWLDYRDAIDLMNLWYSVGFYTNGVFCFNNEQIHLPKNTGLPNSPISFEMLNNTGSKNEFRCYTYAPRVVDHQMQWVYDVHAYMRDHFGHPHWTTEGNRYSQLVFEENAE